MQPDLAQAACRFVLEEGLTGPFHFDLIANEANGKVYFLEINCRLGGTTAKVAHLGYDEPGALLAAFNLSTPLPLPPLDRYTRTTSISLNLHQAYGEFRNRRDPLAYPRVSRFRSFTNAVSESLMIKDGSFQASDPIALLRQLGWRGKG